MPADYIEWSKMNNQKTVKFVVTNYLFHKPLYGYYLFTIDLFDDDDIEGTMMSTVFESEGPFTLTFATELLYTKLEQTNQNA